MTIIFSDGFESGDFTAWTLTENSPTATLTTAHHGSYAMQANLGSWAAANCRANKTITAASTLYTRCYVKMGELFTGSGQKAIGPRYYYGSGAIAYVLVDCIGYKWGIQDAANSQSYFESGTSTIEADRWYCLELYTLVNGTTGQLRLWVDGVLKVEQTGINTGTNQITGVSLNAYSQSAEGVTRTIYFDCAVIADAYIGPEGSEGGSLSASPPLQLSDNVLSIPQANGSTDGYLSASNWNTFNNKQNTLSIGNLNGTSNQVNVSGGTGAVIGSEVTLSLPQNIHTGASPIFAGLTVNGIMNSNASGSYPSPGSNAGMILDCYTPTHQDGLGRQPDGIWLKYDNSFKIYYDNGSSILTAVALDTNGNMIINGYLYPATAGSYPVPHGSAGLKLDFWPPAHSDGIGMQPGGMWIKYGYQFDIFCDSGTSILNSLHLDNSGNMTIAGKLEIPCVVPSYRWSSMAEYQANYEKYLWKLEWYNNQWNWTAMNYTLPIGDSFIRLKDASAPDKYVDIGIIQVETSLEDRTLWISNHLIVKKDFGCGGAAAIMQGALTLGSDWAANDPNGQMPQIVLSHSEGSPYPDNPKRDTLQIWRAGHVGFGNLELGILVAHGCVDIWGGSYQGNVTGYGYLNSNGSHGYISGNSGPIAVSLVTNFRILCGGEIDVYSDQRDKVLVDTLNAQTALSAVKQLSPLQFVWKPETQKGNNVVAGFFAQEVARIIPEAVTIHEGKRYTDEHSLNYNVLTTYALSAIQGLILERDRDNASLTTLTKVVEDLRQKFNKLEQNSQ